jgi:mRNA interferase MazF
MSRHAAGSIVLIDWRGGALPPKPTPEPNSPRPAVVVEDHELFPDKYPTMLAVPLTRNEGLAHKSFAEHIAPAPENGLDVTCWALAHHITSVPLRCVTPTGSRITAAQLANIRKRILVAISAT